VLSAPQFALREVAAQDGERVTAEWIEEALSPLRGRNLVELPLAAVEARLARHPWVEDVELRKELPARLRVAVVERRPVALLLRGGALHFADERGRPIAPVGRDGRAAAAARGLLVIEAPERAPDGLGRALDLAADLGRANATWAAHLTRVEVLGDRDFKVETEALPFTLLLRSGDVVEKVHRLETLLPDLARRYPAVGAVDLRFARRIVVQPVQPSHRPGGGAQARAPHPTFSRGNQSNA
jgi:cell division protein FtsQ